MPNWAENTLIVEGSKKDVLNFIKKAKGKKDKEGLTECLDANSFIPYPKKFDEVDKKLEKFSDIWSERRKKDNYECKSEEQKEQWNKDNPHPRTYITGGYSEDGYRWCCNNWGTKWGFCNTRVGKIEKTNTDNIYRITYEYETAWGPALPLIIKIAEMYPDLYFMNDYEEPGMCFAGTLICSGGKVISDEQRELEMCRECGGSVGNSCCC